MVLEKIQYNHIRGGRGGEISRAKTRETINYFIVKFITINENNVFFELVMTRSGMEQI